MIKSLIVLLISLLVEVIVFFIYIKYLKRKEFTQSIRNEGPRSHHKKSGTPTTGGIIIILFIMINYILLKYFNQKVLNKDDVILFLTIILFMSVGLADDFKIISDKRNNGLKPKTKMIMEIVFSIFLYLMLISINKGKTINIFGMNLELQYFGIIIIPFYLISWSNAYNITDGLDGLASILTYPILIGLFIVGKLIENELLVISSLSIFFAISGFLMFNYHPAMIFMGNIGSHTLGATLAIISILSKTEALLIVMGVVFIFEVISVILQVMYFKITKGKRLFKMAPFHHHLELRGYKENTVNYFLVGLEIVFVLLGVMLWLK